MRRIFFFVLLLAAMPLMAQSRAKVMIASEETTVVRDVDADIASIAEVVEDAVDEALEDAGIDRESLDVAVDFDVAEEIEEEINEAMREMRFERRTRPGVVGSHGWDDDDDHPCGNAGHPWGWAGSYCGKSGFHDFKPAGVFMIAVWLVWLLIFLVMWIITLIVFGRGFAKIAKALREKQK